MKRNEVNRVIENEGLAKVIGVERGPGRRRLSLRLVGAVKEGLEGGRGVRV